MGLEMGSSRFGSNLHSTLGSSKMSPESGELSKTNGLMDSRLTNRRAQRLLHTIKRSESATAAAEDAGTEGLSPILEGIHQWRLRFAWLDLQLLCRQLGSPMGEPRTLPAAAGRVRPAKWTCFWMHSPVPSSTCSKWASRKVPLKKNPIPLGSWPPPIQDPLGWKGKGTNPVLRSSSSMDTWMQQLG